ncbi:hypothetical protein Vafri_11416, partial [Volvox africanus]
MLARTMSLSYKYAHDALILYLRLKSDHYDRPSGTFGSTLDGQQQLSVAARWGFLHRAVLTLLLRISGFTHTADFSKISGSAPTTSMQWNLPDPRRPQLHSWPASRTLCPGPSRTISLSTSG